jgi:beta-galactosidase/beta-glucuronidase
MKQNARLAILLLALSAPSLASSRIDLNRDWQFCIDTHENGEASGWQKRLPVGTESVNVPHTWNLGKHDRYLGKAWYFRTFDMPMQSRALNVELHFGATFYASRIWLNGVEVGSHEGGYTAYSLDITSHLLSTNYLAVEIDNRSTEQTIPGFAMRQQAPRDAWYDWWNYGGIVRDVWLTVSGQIEIRRQRIRSQTKPDGATVEDRIYLKSRFERSQRVSVRLTAFEPDNRMAATRTDFFTVTPADTEINLFIRLGAPQLWGIDRPNVYRMSVEVRDGSGNLLDQQSDTFGLRTIEIRDRHLLVNGERLRLTGLTRHEESLWEGLAETQGTMRHDYDDMKSLQVTLTRPSHYPQNPFILDYADRHGILLIPEIPVWQFSERQLSDPRVLALAKQQMKEMIEQAGNHPSIMAWSVCNESDTGTPGGVAYFRAMRDFIRKLDPDRFVSYADDNLPKVIRAEQTAASDADFLMMNQYFGTWHGPETELSASLDKVDRIFPHKMVIISEFGLPGVFARDAEDADRRRVTLIQEQMGELARRDWIAGAILWCYQDYKSRRNVRFGLEEGYVDHGLVDEYRQRKPSYYVWKQINAPAALSAQWNNQSGGPASFTATVEPNSLDRLPSYPLHDYRLRWEIYGDAKLIAQGESRLEDLSSPQSVSGQAERDAGVHKLQLHFALLRPTGEIAADKTLDWVRSQDSSGRTDTTVPARSAGEANKARAEDDKR